MDSTTIKPVNKSEIVNEAIPLSTDQPFMQANTVESSLSEIRDKHIIPVFIKDNEPTISMAEFIDATMETVGKVFAGKQVLSPSVRLSHPIKGRIPEAKHKPASQLQEHEKTLYYERCAFIIELPNIRSRIDGNLLSLTIGGVKAYNLDNLYSRKGTDEHFKVFIGFQNKVCTNLCVSTDGYLENLTVKNVDHLQSAMQSLFQTYDVKKHLTVLNRLNKYSLTEQQFATMIGRCRMYNHLPNDTKSDIAPLLFNDTQINTVVKDYYRDTSFCKSDDGSINLWKLYNLFTGSNKSSYIDTFLDRSVNAFQFSEQIRSGLENQNSWFLN